MADTPGGTTAGNTGEPVRDRFYQSFAAAANAAKEHLADPEGHPLETDDDEDAGDEPQARADVDDATDSTEPGAAVDTKGEETETDDEPAAGADDEGDDDENPLERLISDREYQTLAEKHKDDPVALRKSLEGAFTRKTQKLAALRDQYEAVRPYLSFVKALEEDREGTLRKAAELNGFELVPKGTPAGTSTTPAVADDEILNTFREALGEDNAYLAEQLGPALVKTVQQLTNGIVEKTVKPLQEQTEAINNERADKLTKEIMSGFEAKHPDWKEHEAAMEELAGRLHPKGMSETDYLELLYNVVTAPVREKAHKDALAKAEAAGAKKVVTQMNAAEPGTRRTPTPASQVKPKAPENLTFAAAARAARQGIRFADDDE